MGESRNTGKPSIPIWLGFLAIAVGVAFVGIAYVIAKGELRYADEGRTVQATVTGMRIEMSDADDESDRYLIRYEFVDPASGATYTGVAEVGQFRYASLDIGDTLEVSYLLSDPSRSRLGSPEPQLHLPAALGIFGGAGILAGPLFVWSSIRQRRLGQTAGVDDLPSPGPDPKRVDVFTRPPAFAAAGAFYPFLALGFLAVAGFGLSQAGNMPSLLVLTLVGTIVGLLFLAGAASHIRRGFGLKVAEVGPDALWVRGLGRVGWAEVAELRLERMRRRPSSEAAATTQAAARPFVRLGIVTAGAQSAAGANDLVRRIGAAVTELANDQARRAGRRVRPKEGDDATPFGLAAQDIEQPFEELVASVRRFAPVVEHEVGAVPADAQRAPAVEAAPDPDPVTPEQLRKLDALLGLPSAVVAATDPGSIIAAPPPAAAPATFVEAAPPTLRVPDRPRTRTFYRRGAGPEGLGGAVEAVASVGSGLSQLWSAVVWAIFVVFPLLFVANGLALLAKGDILNGLMFAVLPLSFSLVGVGGLLGDLARWPLMTGDADLLRVGPDGVTAKGFGHLRWSEVAEVTADDDTLTIRPTPDAVLDERFWAASLRDRYRGALRRILPFGPRPRRSYDLDFALLEADRDEVLDAIAAHRLVTEG